MISAELLFKAMVRLAKETPEVWSETLDDYPEPEDAPQDAREAYYLNWDGKVPFERFAAILGEEIRSAEAK